MKWGLQINGIHVCQKEHSDRLFIEKAVICRVGTEEVPTMKQLVPIVLRATLLIVLATFSLQVWGADCSSTDILLSTQVDVDNFQSAYGGGGVCNKVSGSLIIRDSADITNLDGLSSLTNVGRNLEIFENDALVDLDGLSSLTSVGGDLLISSNHALTNLDGLSSLTNVTSVGGGGYYMQISGNDALANLNGLSSLARIGGILYIFDNDALTNLDGLSSLTSIGYELDIQNNLVLSRCTALALLLGWPVGPPDDNIGGYIFVRNNQTGCNSVQEILASVQTAPIPTMSHWALVMLLVLVGLMVFANRRRLY